MRKLIAAVLIAAFMMFAEGSAMAGLVPGSLPVEDEIIKADQGDQTSPKARKKGKKWLWALLGVVLIAGAGAAAAAGGGSGGSDDSGGDEPGSGTIDLSW